MVGLPSLRTNIAMGIAVVTLFSLIIIAYHHHQQVTDRYNHCSTKAALHSIHPNPAASDTLHTYPHHRVHGGGVPISAPSVVSRSHEEEESQPPPTYYGPRREGVPPIASPPAGSDLPPIIVPATDRYLITSIRDDGFNNQLMSMYNAMAMAMELNRTWVLPWFMQGFQYHTKPHGPWPFEDFFDVDNINRASNGKLRVITVDDFLKVGGVHQSVCNSDTNKWKYVCNNPLCPQYPFVGNKPLPIETTAIAAQREPQTLDDWINESTPCFVACQCALHPFVNRWYPTRDRIWQVI
jgi:hypothetical protein